MGKIWSVFYPILSLFFLWLWSSQLCITTYLPISWLHPSLYGKNPCTSCVNLFELKYFWKWYSCLLTSNHTSAKDFCLSWTSQWEILLFLFYDLLKSANLSNLFSFLFDIFIYASMYIDTYILPKLTPTCIYIHVNYAYIHAHRYAQT